jgi:hypothetical protein
VNTERSSIAEAFGLLYIIRAPRPSTGSAGERGSYTGGVEPSRDNRGELGYSEKRVASTSSTKAQTRTAAPNAQILHTLLVSEP